MGVVDSGGLALGKALQKKPWQGKETAQFQELKKVPLVGFFP